LSFFFRTATGFGLNRPSSVHQDNVLKQHKNIIHIEFTIYILMYGIAHINNYTW